ncbi:MAG: DUF1016 N-terminal domain-containing protein [Bacteroidales bacterium]|nr:DUF1016 N-terminal domain-containing protein [Bacteroidales bacterium]
MPNLKVENTEIDVSEQSFVSEAKQIVQKGRQQAYAAINSAMVETYWQLGRRIVEQEQAGRERADYGTHLLNVLSDDLTREFGKGFTARALRYFHQFYLAFQTAEIWNTRVPFLTCLH